MLNILYRIARKPLLRFVLSTFILLQALASAPAFTPTALAKGSSAAGDVAFAIGPGFTDVVPHQIVRTSADKVYIFVAQAQYSSTLKAYWTPNAGLPNSGLDFSGTTQTTDTANIISVDAVYDGGNMIFVLVNNQSGQLKAFPFDTTSGVFKPAISIANGVPTVSGDYIGTSGVSGMIDAAGRLHVAYWASGDHITHRAYTYTAASNTLSLVEGPTQVDTAGGANHPAVAVAPANNSLTVAWVSEATNPARILARTRTGSGSWGTVETVSTAPVWISTNAGKNIDQGPSLVIDGSGKKHLAYMENYDGTGDYGRVHYVVNPGSGWTDQALSFYTHDPALAINSAGDIYLLGHGFRFNSACQSMLDMCSVKRNADGAWALPQIVAAPPSADSFDASPSVKWSAVGWNRPETIEFLFFSANNGNYNNTTVYYARLGASGGTAPTATNTTAPPTATKTLTRTSTPVPTTVPPTATSAGGGGGGASTTCSFLPGSTSGAGVYFDVQAETMSGVVAGTGIAASKIWNSVKNYAGYKGASAMQAQTNSGVSTGNSTNGPRMDYVLNFPTPGTYYVYVYGMADTLNAPGSDSIHVGLNGNAVTLNSLGLTGFTSTGFSWRNFYGSLPTSVSVPSAGKHTLNLWMREDGVIVDEIVVSTVGTLSATTLGGLADSPASGTGCAPATAAPTATSTPTATRTPTRTSPPPTATSVPPTATPFVTIVAPTPLPSVPTNTPVPSGGGPTNTLLGYTEIGDNDDYNPPGMAEAFIYMANISGTVTRLSVYVDADNSATQVVIGLYNNAAGDNPGSLLTQAVINNPANDAWNTVTVPAASVVAGQKYWLAILGPAGSGVVQFKDTGSGNKAQTSAQTDLITLPANWSPGTNYLNAPLSAYASGTP
jgi:hypothetical protein